MNEPRVGKTGTPRVVMFSIWRNEMRNRLHDRACSLLAKSYPNLRWVWIVGDSTDETSYVLRYVKGVRKNKDIEIIECNTGIVCGEQDYVERRKRISLTFNHFFDRIRDDDVYCFQHESDLITPVDITERLLATGKCPVAGWPTLTRETRIDNQLLPPFARGKETFKQETLFYDTFAYKKDGVNFTNEKPYHACYKPNELFEVDSVGSAYLFYAQDIRDGVRCYDEACVELCRKFKEKGRSIWVDPKIEVVQPESLLSINRKD